MLILSERELSKLLNMRDVIEAVESGFRALAAGEARAPGRSRLDIPESSATLLEMPAYAKGALGTKIVSVFENNSGRGLETVQALYLLFDSETGTPLALMEGRFITAIRTAAASALATRLMASPGPKQLAIFGAGVQARFHAEAMIEVAEVEKVSIHSRTEARACSLAEFVMAELKLPCDVVGADEAASRADLICACTSSPLPLFDGRLVKAGAHINAVGGFTPTTRELDSETVRRSRVVIDDESAAGQEAGELIIPLAEGAIAPGHIKGTLAGLVSGKIRGRESVEEITLFKSCGLAIEDLVTARLAYRRAVDRGVGVRAEI